jgi:hypothetical protein
MSLLDEQQVASHHQARRTHIRALPFSYSAQFPAHSFEACVFAWLCCALEDRFSIASHICKCADQQDQHCDQTGEVKERRLYFGSRDANKTAKQRYVQDCNSLRNENSCVRCSPWLQRLLNAFRSYDAPLATPDARGSVIYQNHLFTTPM